MNVVKMLNRSGGDRRFHSSDTVEVILHFVID